MTINDPNKPLKVPWSEHPIHPKHFLMHMMTGTLVFSSGILTSMYIEDYRHTKPHRVYWQNNELQDDHSIANVKFPPPGNIPVEFGVRDDGILVWRLKK